MLSGILRGDWPVTQIRKITFTLYSEARFRLNIRTTEADIRDQGHPYKIYTSWILDLLPSFRSTMLNETLK